MLLPSNKPPLEDPTEIMHCFCIVAEILYYHNNRKRQDVTAFSSIWSLAGASRIMRARVGLLLLNPSIGGLLAVLDQLC